MKKAFSFKDLKKRTRFHHNPIFKIWKPQSYIAIIIATLICGLFYFYYRGETDIQSNLNIAVRDILITSAFALIGVLGFLISGLAILTGTINSKIVDKIYVRNKYDNLMSIFCSFYHLGISVCINIILLLVSYFLVPIAESIDHYQIFSVITSWVVSYIFIFIILYVAHLLKSCIAIFEISYIYSTEEEADISFADLKIDGITLVLLRKGFITKNEFLTILDECIETQYNFLSLEQKTKLREKVKKEYTE